jgi:hypothetical protein
MKDFDKVMNYFDKFHFVSSNVIVLQMEVLK